MTGKVGSSPEAFSLSPLLSLLPDAGDLARLESLVSSWDARHEKVEALRLESPDRESERQYALEGAMLRQILDWLAERPEHEE